MRSFKFPLKERQRPAQFSYDCVGFALSTPPPPRPEGPASSAWWRSCVRLRCFPRGDQREKERTKRPWMIQRFGSVSSVSVRRSRLAPLRAARCARAALHLAPLRALNIRIPCLSGREAGPLARLHRARNYTPSGSRAARHYGAFLASFGRCGTGSHRERLFWLSETFSRGLLHTFVNRYLFGNAV